MVCFEDIAVEGYEKVVKVTDSQCGLTAIIAIHNTTLGPALGGIRIYPYATFDAALEDVLRLARGMSYKAAVAEIGLGGGKAVIIADHKTGKTPEMLLAFGAAVEKLQGAYICAQDVGSTTKDLQIVRKATRYVVGLPDKKSSDDPGPFTAWGTFRGIQSVMKKLYKEDSLKGKKVAVQGVGSVGGYLAEFLFWAGAELILSDVDAEKLHKYVLKYRAKIVPPDQILKVECDILAPCAMGGIINDQSIPEFRCKAIAGSANNQLLQDKHAQELKDRGILYAPDFVIGAGGLINVSMELTEEGYNPILSRNKVDCIYDTLLSIYAIADKNKESTQSSALALAHYQIQNRIGKRKAPPSI